MDHWNRTALLSLSYLFQKSGKYIVAVKESERGPTHNSAAFLFFSCVLLLLGLNLLYLYATLLFFKFLFTKERPRV